jgi:hypothetical protein
MRSVIMTNFKTIAIGTAGLALSLAAAAPAAAQQYGYGYPQNNGGVVGAIVNAVTGGGYGQYPMGNYGYNQVSQRQLVQQCAAAAEQRISGSYRGQGYGAYNGNGYQNGYGQQGYGYQNQNGARVLGVTSVEARPNGGLRVRGVATSGAYGQQGYGQQGYGQRYQNGYGANAQADLSFNCKVSSRGQITDVTIARNNVRYSRGY